MAIVRANVSQRLKSAGTVMRRCFVAGVFLCLAAVSALAQTEGASENVVVTLLPSFVHTTDVDSQTKKLLTVAAPGGADFKEARSWLYFPALPLSWLDIKEKDIISAQLLLVPVAGASRGMTITVSPAEEKVPEGASSNSFIDVDHTQPLSYSAPGSKQYTLVSPPLPADPQLRELRSDSVVLGREGLLKTRRGYCNDDGCSYIGLVLLPQPNASRRVYYGLNSGDIAAHPDRLPRLLITIKRQIQPTARAGVPVFSNPLCTTEPSAHAFSQSDGRMANSSSCSRIPTGNPPTIYTRIQAGISTLTQSPVVYRDRLYVVRRVGAETRLEELSPGGVVRRSIRLDGEVPPGSPMVVDYFGKLSIVTNDAIYSVRLGRTPSLPDGLELPAYVVKRPFAFDQVPTAVVPGLDGTLYIVKNSIFALNPDVGKLANGEIIPEKHWDVGIENPGTARITLSPGGRFLYVLARFSGGKSRFIVINAQTGRDVQLPAKANFPENLITFRNPVVARGSNGVDYVFITGNSGSGATLWGVKNDPETRDGNFVARLTEVWKYPVEKDNAIGQPILDPAVPRKGEGLNNKKLYFLKGGAGKPKLIAIRALDGKVVNETPDPNLPETITTDESPVIDSAGNVFIWASDTLYGFTADTKRSFTVKPPISAAPQLLFGPGGRLGAAYGLAGSTTVSFIDLVAP